MTTKTQPKRVTSDELIDYAARFLARTQFKEMRCNAQAEALLLGFDADHARLAKTTTILPP